MAYALEAILVDEKRYELGGWNRLDPVIVTVTPGEIAYLGHVVVAPQEKDGKEWLELKVEDRYDRFAQTYRLPMAWDMKIYKRLLVLPPRLPLP